MRSQMEITDLNVFIVFKVLNSTLVGQKLRNSKDPTGRLKCHVI